MVGHVATAVLDLDDQPGITRQLEVLVGDVDDLRVELDSFDSHAGEVAPGPLGRRAAAEPDVEHPACLRSVGEGQLEIVGVDEARPVRVVEEHPALEGAVEAEVATGVVVDDGDAVVLRVRGVDDLVARLRLLDPAAAVLGDRCRYTGDQFRSCEAATVPPLSGASETTAPTLAPASTRASANASASRSTSATAAAARTRAIAADRQHLVGAELGDQPERRQERAGDRARRRDGEEPPGRPAEFSIERAFSRTATGDTLPRTTLGRPKRRMVAITRVQPRAGIPLDDAVQNPAVDERDREHEQRAERRAGRRAGEASDTGRP